MKTTLITIFLGLLTLGSLQAQKYGHINSNQILSVFPEVKAADTQLESYSKQLIQKGQSMMDEYKKAYEGYVAKANKGELSQLQMQTEEGKLTELQQKIQAYEVEVQNLVAKKKQEIYQPVLDKVNAAIAAVGKENGYTMIFDSGSFGMVFAADSEDVMSLVKAKLGIQ